MPKLSEHDQLCYDAFYSVYNNLPDAERASVKRFMKVLQDNVPGLGPVGAIEVAGAVGMFLVRKGGTDGVDER